MRAYVALATAGAVAGAAVLAHVIERHTRPRPWARLGLRMVGPPAQTSTGWASIAEITSLEAFGPGTGAAEPREVRFEVVFPPAEPTS